jgi:hypothetical protein
MVEKIFILIVEDNPDGRFILQQSLGDQLRPWP